MSVAGPAHQLSLWRKAPNGGYTESASVPMAHESSIFDSVFSPDSKFLASREIGSEVRIWDTSLIQEAETTESKEEPVATLRTRASSFVYSPGGRYSATGNHGGNVEVWQDHAQWDTRERPLKTFRGHTDRVVAIAFGS
jgi:WD40 repeat protein